MSNNEQSINVTRQVTIQRNVSMHAEGSVLICCGNTKIICTASVEEGVPNFLRGTEKGWVTAEYGMLPRATNTRNRREAKAKQSGRTQEIQRLIGRSLRAAVELEKIGDNTITIDCDVIQADGGTRTASITGGYIALVDAITYLKNIGKIQQHPIKNKIAAISVGIIDGSAVLDLNYEQDYHAETDMNIVMNDDGHYIEVQGTAEIGAYSHSQLEQMLKLGQQGIEQLFVVQEQVLGS